MIPPPGCGEEKLALTRRFTVWYFMPSASVHIINIIVTLEYISTNQASFIHNDPK
jgi:hypothetical protein